MRFPETHGRSYCRCSNYQAN